MIQQQTIPINFSQGLDTKTDPKQVQIGKFLKLQNTVFQKGGLLTKRNGFGNLPALPDNTYSYLTTFNGDLTAIGPTLAALSTSSGDWVSKGSIDPMSINTLPLVRNSLNQVQCDAAISANGLVCTAYTETGATTVIKYVIADSVTGQNITAPTVIPTNTGTPTGSPRVFVAGTYFIIVFTNLVSATSHLQYVVIGTGSPSVVSANLDIATAYTPSDTVSWDGVVVAGNNSLYIAYNTTAGGQAVKVTYLSQPIIASAFSASPLSPVTPVIFTGSIATMMSLCVDNTEVQNPTIYVNFYDSASQDGYTLAVSSILNVITEPVLITSGFDVRNLASVAQNGSCTIFLELFEDYSFSPNKPSHLILSTIVTPLPVPFKSVFSSGASSIVASSAAGLSDGMSLVDNTTPGNLAPGTTISGSAGTTIFLSANTTGNSASSPGDSIGAITITGGNAIARSVGLASKAFILDGVIYFLAAYQSTYQPTYFLINASESTEANPVVVAKLAYSNGGGYCTLGLPSVTVNGNTISIPYLFKDLIAAVNKGTNLTSTAQNPVQLSGIYSQTGVNLGTFEFGTQGLSAVEIGNNLNLSGGFGWAYDGVIPTEQNFFLWPDDLAAVTHASAVTPTGTVTTGSNIITAVSALTGVGLGASVTGTGIPANQLVTGFTANTITFGPLTATGTHSAETITVTGNISTAQQYYYQATYEWSDNQGNAFRSAPSIPITVTTTGTTSYNVVNVPTLRLTYKIASPVKIVLYRWSVAQQEYFQVTSITQPTLNDTTGDSVAIVDALSDASILGNNLIYTTGGVVEDVNPPASNIMALFDTRAWLVDAEDQNLLWFSKQVIEATPVEWSDLFTLYVPPTTAAQGSTGVITALCPLDDKLIIFKKNAIYYINGSGPDNTGANNQYSQPIFITSTVGCIDQNSIVFTDAGLMFQSNKGIWLLSRGSAQTGMADNYVGAPVEMFNASTVESAVNVPATTQVRFTLDTGEHLMFDYYYGQWGTFTGVPAISSTIYQGLHTFINKFGQVFQETPGIYLDGTNPVLISFLTGNIQLAGISGYQRIYELQLLGQYISPHLLQVQFGYDFAGLSEQAIIEPTNATGVYGSDAVYGQTSPYGGPGVLEQWRIQPATQKCQTFQFSLQEIYDPSFGVVPGAGFTLSAMTCTIGVNRQYRPVKAANTVGTG